MYSADGVRHGPPHSRTLGPLCGCVDCVEDRRRARDDQLRARERNDRRAQELGIVYAPPPES